jgi:hypothetical protein
MHCTHARAEARSFGDVDRSTRSETVAVSGEETWASRTGLVARTTLRPGPVGFASASWLGPYGFSESKTRSGRRPQPQDLLPPLCPSFALSSDADLQVYVHTSWPWIPRAGRGHQRNYTTAPRRHVDRSESRDHYCKGGAAAWRSLGSCAEQC